MKVVGIERARAAANVITIIKEICVINAKIRISFSKPRHRIVQSPSVHDVISLARYFSSFKVVFFTKNEERIFFQISKNYLIF